MFKRVTDIGNQVQLNKSDIKDFKKGLTTKYPLLEPYIEDIVPKKGVVFGMRLKSNDKTELFIYENQIICFKKGKEYIPTLWLLHQYPHIMPHFQVDKGAIRFILGGADIMCPGLTSAGGKMDDVEAGTVVAIHAEGKQHAIGIGVAIMSSKEIKEKNKDIGVTNVQYVGDDLWKLDVTQ